MTRHSSRHAITWHERVQDLPDSWDNPLPAGHFLQRKSLEAHERAALPHLKTIYATVVSDQKVVMQAAFQVLSLQAGHLNPAAMAPWQRTAFRLFAGIARPRLLVAGQLFRHDVASAWWADALPLYDAFRHYRTLIRQALKRSCAQAVLVKEPPEAFVPYFQHYAPEYLLLRNDSSMQMALPGEWTTFTDYEKSLKHKYAQRLRKVRQSWAGLEVRELDETAVVANAAALYGLYLQVTNNQPVRLGLLSEQYLPELKKCYGKRLKVWGIYEGNALIAFASAWVQRESFDMFYIGFDYARNSDLQLYFNLLFFAIEQAILLQKPLLILGRTALEAKARVGCLPVYLHTFLFIRNPLLRSILGRMQQRFSEPTGEWENRHPFKKERNA